MRLRYVGPQVTEFLDYGQLAPGDEFDVDGELAERFLNHGYIERVDPPKAAGKKPDMKAAKAEAGGDGKPDTGTNQ